MELGICDHVRLVAFSRGCYVIKGNLTVVNETKEAIFNCPLSIRLVGRLKKV